MSLISPKIQKVDMAHCFTQGLNLKVYIFVSVYSEEIIKLFIFICDIFKCINTFYTNCISILSALTVYLLEGDNLLGKALLYNLPMR